MDNNRISLTKGMKRIIHLKMMNWKWVRNLSNGFNEIDHIQDPVMDIRPSGWCNATFVIIDWRYCNHDSSR
jgi:hypothetical protein